MVCMSKIRLIFALIIHFIAVARNDIVYQIKKQIINLKKTVVNNNNTL